MDYDQAMLLLKSKFWENLNDEEVVRFQLFEERLCMPFDVFHKAVEKVLGRPVQTVEFGATNGEHLKREYFARPLVDA